MKKVLAFVLATSMALSMSAVAFAATTDVNGTVVVNSDGKGITKSSEAKLDLTNGATKGTGIFDVIAPDQTFYVGLENYKGTTINVHLSQKDGTEIKKDVPAAWLADSDLFKLSTKDKKGDAGKLIKITQEDAKTIDGYVRGSWLKVVVGNTMTSDELKGTMSLEFKPQSDFYKAYAKKTSATVDTVKADFADVDVFTMDFTFWVNNKIVKGSDADEDTGSAFVFKPSSNEENTIIWGDDRAALKFDADDDAAKFYAKLSTKSNSAIYSEYADPVGADLWFYDFVGASKIPATSRATLTLGIPWDVDSDYVPASPEDCFIYRVDADGMLVDVTKSFEYKEDGDVDGWWTRTRELGVFIVSDMELDIEVAGATEEPVSSAVSTPDKVIPNTGSSDMVNVAVVAAVVSLAAAGAVAFRKVK